jgi:DNA polymerase III subunit beta
VKFRCERDTLADAISTAQRAVASRSGALPVLSGLRVSVGRDSLELVGSDLELTIRVHAPAQSIEEGVAVVPARLFGDIVRALEPGPVDVQVGDDEAHITSGRSNFSLRVLAADDFPRLPDVGGSAVEVGAPALAEALRQVVPAASRDDARPILTGVLLTAVSGGLRLVATDSYRLAVRDLQGVSMLEPGQRVLVAAKALSEVQRLLGDGTIEVTLSERDAKFRIGEAEVTTRLIEGEFPNYEQLIPSGYPNRLTVEREALAEAVRRVRLVGQGRDGAPIRLAMSTTGMELSAVAQEVGEARELVEAKYEGGDLTAAFNAQFLLDGIDSVTSSEVVVETIDALKPATLRETDRADFLYLLMPVRIS